MKILPLIVFVLVVLPSVVTSAKYCSAGKNRFYKDGKCRRCPRCVTLLGLGYGRNKTEKIELKSGRFGDLECYPCMKCPQGYFNDGSYKECVPCRIDCKGQNRTIDIPCNSKSDIKCGKCLDNYYCPENDRNYPCIPLPQPAPYSNVIKVTTTTEKTKTELWTARSATHVGNAISSSSGEQPTVKQTKSIALEQRKEPNKKTYGDDKLLDDLPLIVVVVFVISGTILFFIGKECLPHIEWRRVCKCSKHENTTMSSTATILKSSLYGSTPGKENSVVFLSGSDDLRIDGGSEENVTSNTPLMQQYCRAERPFIVPADQIIAMTKPSEVAIDGNEEGTVAEPDQKNDEIQVMSSYTGEETAEMSYQEENEFQTIPKHLADGMCSVPNGNIIQSTYGIQGKTDPLADAITTMSYQQEMMSGEQQDVAETTYNERSAVSESQNEDHIQASCQFKDESQGKEDSQIQKEKFGRSDLLTERQVSFIATHMDKDGWELFAELKLRDCEVKPLEIEYLQKNLTFKEFVYRVLMRWKEIEANNARFDTVYDAIVRVRYESLVDAIHNNCDIFGDIGLR